MFIDSHAHINFKDYQDDADEVIRRALANDTWMVLVGSEYKTSNRALTYANKFEKGVYVAVGLHPIHLEEQVIRNKDKEEGNEYQFTTRAEEFNYDAYEKLAKFEKVVAIGEIGLDYFHLDPSKDIPAAKRKQQEVFLKQLVLACQLDLPVIIHCRQAHDDLLEILRDFRKVYTDYIPTDRPWGVLHCFSGDEDLAWKYFTLGLIVSFTGLITFSKQWDDLLRKIPLDRFMLETDSPYMTPEPYRGQRNEPLLVQYVAARIAEIRNTSVENIAAATTETARKFFRI